MGCKDYTIPLSSFSLTGLFAEVGGLLLFPLGCPFSQLHWLLEPLRMHPAVVSCGFKITASAQGQEPTRTSEDGQTPTFVFGEPQVQFPANMSLFRKSCVTMKRPDTELWSCGLQPLLFLWSRRAELQTQAAHMQFLLFAPRMVLDFWFRSNVNLEN